MAERREPVALAELPHRIPGGVRRRGAALKRAGKYYARLLRPRDPWVVDETGTALDQRRDLADFDIGRYSWGHLTVTNRAEDTTLRVGQFCSFAMGCHVLLGGEHRYDFVSMKRFPAIPPFPLDNPEAGHTLAQGRGDVVIGNDVWVGHGSLIISGVEIGDGAVVGAGSVVRRDVPPYAIVVGNPARVTGFRFSPEQISALLRIRWWDWPLAGIGAATPMLMSDDAQAFIDAAEAGTIGPRRG